MNVISFIGGIFLIGAVVNYFLPIGEFWLRDSIICLIIGIILVVGGFYENGDI